MIKFKRAISMIFVIAMVMSLVACGTQSSTTGSTVSTEESGTGTTQTAETTSSAPSYGGSINVYYNDFSNTFDPSLTYENRYALWFERLWTIDLNSDTNFNTSYISSKNLTGQLAKSWTFDAAAKTLTVELRDDVYFQTKADSQYDIYGGRKMVADDVAWSYRRLIGCDGATKCAGVTDWSSYLSMLDSVTVDGDNTVVFHFNTSSEVALDSFMCQGVNIAGPEWDKLTADQQNDWHYACGTGPYILSEYVTDNYMKFVRNDNYYGTDTRKGYEGNKLPYLDSVTLTAYSDNSNALSQFISGNLDVLAAKMDLLTTSEKDMLTSSLSADDYTDVMTSAGVSGIGLKQTFKPFQDEKVRTAMQYAINSAEIHSQFYGYTNDLEMSGPYSTDTDYTSIGNWSDELKDSYYNCNIEKAKELMQEAGYGDGFEFNLVLFSKLNTDLYTLTASYLEKIGIKMNIQQVNSISELMATVNSADNEMCGTNGAGNTSIRQVFSNLSTTGDTNCLKIGLSDGGKIDQLLAASDTATTPADQNAALQAVDQYVAEGHYILELGGITYADNYYSNRLSGLNGIHLFTNWNITTCLANAWVTD